MTQMVASWQSLTLRSSFGSRRRCAAPPKPRLGDGAGGAGSQSPSEPETDHSTALFAEECQSFPNHFIADFRHEELSDHEFAARDDHQMGVLVAAGLAPVARETLDRCNPTGSWARTPPEEPVWKAVAGNDPL
jgi:hypothetical protein